MIIELLKDIKIDIFDDDKSVLSNMLQTKEYEPHIQNVFSEFVRDGNTIMDIGANFGQHTVFMSRLAGESGYVYAIEANPSNVTKLRSTVSINNCNNVKIIECGLWDQNGEMEIERHGACSFLVRDERTHSSKITTRKLDDIVDENEIKEIHLIKMDIEGSELFALRGGAETIKKYQPLLVVELNSFCSVQFMGINIMEVVDYIYSLGYKHAFLVRWEDRRRYEVDRNYIEYHFAKKDPSLIDVLFSF